MESFWRRLRYYGIGFGIGLLFVFVFFQNRGCSWLPSNRVKNSILDRILVLPDDQEKAMKGRGVTQKDIIGALNEGDVSFSESKKKDALKVYKIEHQRSTGKSIVFFFTLPKESFISEVHFTERNAFHVVNSRKGKGRIIRVPNDEALVFLEPDPLVKCMVDRFFSKKEKGVLRALKTKGSIDFDKTRFNARPKANQSLLLKGLGGQIVRAEAIWYKNKVNITSMTSENMKDCQ
jgi:hypothetical protein